MSKAMFRDAIEVMVIREAPKYVNKKLAQPNWHLKEVKMMWDKSEQKHTLHWILFRVVPDDSGAPLSERLTGEGVLG